MDLHKLLSSLDRVEEVTIDVVPAGLGFAVTDASHVAMVAALVDKTAFELYQIGEVANYQMSLNLERLRTRSSGPPRAIS